MQQNPKKAFGDKKPPLGQLPLIGRIMGALAFYDGSGKYGYRNWRVNHVEAQTYIEAINRHTELYANGEDYARDTRIHNLGGVIASAALLLDAEFNGCLIDNRVKSQAACDLLHDAEADIARLNEMHAALRASRENGVEEAKPFDPQKHMGLMIDNASKAIENLLVLDEANPDRRPETAVQLRRMNVGLLRLAHRVMPDIKSTEVLRESVGPTDKGPDGHFG